MIEAPLSLNIGGWFALGLGYAVLIAFAAIALGVLFGILAEVRRKLFGGGNGR